MNKIIQSKTVAWILIICLISLLLYLNIFSSGKKAEQRIQTKIEIKKSEEAEKTYKKEYDSVVVKNNQLENKINNIKPIYIQGKETVKYIDSSRIKAYTDTLCKKMMLKSQLNNADTLISAQEDLLFGFSNQIALSEKIIQEKENQIYLYKNKKPPSKPFGIGVIGGYGTDFTNGVKPFVGVGISYNIIRL
jgi:hypothetical protein